MHWPVYALAVFSIVGLILSRAFNAGARRPLPAPRDEPGAVVDPRRGLFEETPPPARCSAVTASRWR